MKIAHFSLQQWEKDYILAQLPQHEHIFVNEVNVVDSIDKIKDCDILTVFIYNNVTGAVIDAMVNLKVILTRSTGFDHIDLEYARKKGIQVANAQAYGSQTIAEHTFGLLLTLAKNITELSARCKDSNFSYLDRLGFELGGKTFGVIGSGRIGKNVIRIAQSFGMNCIVYDLFQDPKLKQDFGVDYVELDTLLTTSDIITLHVPLTPETKQILSKENLQKISPGTILINTARGGLIDNDDLLNALQTGIIGGAGLDTIQDEDRMYHMHDITNTQQQIIQHPAVIFTPHSAYYTKDALTRILDTTIQNIINSTNGIALESVC